MAQIKAKIIDVGYAQGVIDWEKVKPHIDGAILRCGYGMDLAKQDDTYFKRNAAECTRLGIPFGVYIYSYADSVERAKSEAAHVLRLIKGCKLSYPVYLDLEEGDTRSGAIERANAFGDIIEKAGYWCGIYANLHWWNNYLKGLDRFTKWVAQWGVSECQYKGSNLDMWQYSDKGKISGINGNVDMNYCYRDLPAEIAKTEDTVTAVVPDADTDETQNAKPAETVKATDYARHFLTTLAGTYKVTAAALNVRNGAGIFKSKLVAIPKNTKVKCYGYYSTYLGAKWLYVTFTYNGTSYEGFCHSKYLKKV